MRPEFVSFAAEGLPVEIVKVSDAGRYRIVEARHGDKPHQCAGRGRRRDAGRGRARAVRSGPYAALRRRLAGGVSAMYAKTENQMGWLYVLPVVVLVAFNAVIPLMAVVNYSVQETFGNNVFFFEGVKWFEQVLHSDRFHASLLRQLAFTGIILAIEVPLGVAIALAMPRKGPWVSVCLVLMALPLLIPWNVVGAMWNIFALPDIGMLGRTLNRLGLELQLHPAAALRLGDADRHGRLALDLAGGAARLCGAERDSGGLLPGRQDRRRVLLGGVPLHPAAQDEAGADHRGAAALHGQRSTSTPSRSC